MAEQRNLAVIGAGPKAAAIAAKAWCLRQTGSPVRVTIFEADEVGAAWTGRHGYTDGVQRLCTPAERDLGFPYGTAHGQVVASLMQAHFSWMAFMSARSKDEGNYADWVDRGRKPPLHADFAAYLADAIGRSGAQLLDDGPVTGLRHDGRHWTILQSVNGIEASVAGFDGVVATGPGPAAGRFDTPANHRRIVDGVTFWLERERLLADLTRRERRVVIVGGGGTAAAIAAWLVGNGVTREIVIVLNQATLYTRTTNFFESRLYSDPAAWDAVGAAEKDAFAARLNRSVVWEAVTDVLADAHDLVLTPGEVERVQRGRAGPNDLDIHLKNIAAPIHAGLVIDAGGFDSWWFAALVKDADVMAAVARFRTGGGRMRTDLSLDAGGFPRLHLPWHSQSEGPGFMSLMVLGEMADRILASYI